MSMVSGVLLSLLPVVSSCAWKVGQLALCVLIEVSPKWREVQSKQHWNHPMDSRVVIGVRWSRS